MRRRGGQRGYTLLEVLAVVAIAVGLVMVAGVGIRRLRQSDLRTAASRLAGAIRFSYDRAATSGRYYRMVIDLDQKTYWPEVSDDRFYLVRGGSRPPTEDEADTAKTAAAKAKGGGGAGLLGLLAGGANVPAATVAAKVGMSKARFSAASSASAKRRQAAPLRGITIAAVWTARFDEPVTQGKAYLYFYPEGRTERAIIQLADTADGVYSLVVHPLTGRVQIFASKVEIPRSGTGATDDTGETSP